MYPDESSPARYQSDLQSQGSHLQTRDTLPENDCQKFRQFTNRPLSYSKVIDCHMMMSPAITAVINGDQLIYGHFTKSHHNPLQSLF